ncbi:MAG: 50S ribosomal protein L21 [Planctomycetes bacterium RBG_16_59_8]|nr:MAG: 50S ribosomal protein L21 [Planctomycetes bacterium RBG_16_59_8]
MYAIVKDGSKQYRMEKGMEILVDLKGKKQGESVEFPNVMVYHDGEKVKIGTPYVKGVKVAGEVLGDIKDGKIFVYKYQRREGYQRGLGHRQRYTRVKINDFVTG